MSENPFTPPPKSDQQSHPAKRKPSTLGLNLYTIGLSILSGLVMYVCLVSGSVLVTRLYTIAFFAIPPLAFTTSIYKQELVFLGRVGMPVFSGIKLYFLFLALFIAAYITFATTCVGANIAAIRPMAYSPYPITGGILTGLSTFFGCIMAMGLHRLIRK